MIIELRAQNAKEVSRFNLEWAKQTKKFVSKQNKLQRNINDKNITIKEQKVKLEQFSKEKER